MTFLERIDQLNQTVNKNNIFSPPMSSDEALNFLQEYLLGKDWYVVDPLSPMQVNTHIVYDILRKYSKRFRKELKKERKEKKI